MLVLTRRIGETLLLGDDINVVVLAVRGKQIKLGIDAPHSITVHREEVRTQMTAEAAAHADASPRHTAPIREARRRCRRRRR